MSVVEHCFGVDVTLCARTPATEGQHGGDGFADCRLKGWKRLAVPGHSADGLLLWRSQEESAGTRWLADFWDYILIIGTIGPFGLLLLLVWHAPLRVRVAKRRHQSPEWTILSHVNCFIQGEVVGFQILLDSLRSRSTRVSWWLIDWLSTVYPKGQLLRSRHLFWSGML